MQSTKVYTDDDKRKDEGETDYIYYTEDVLYPAYGDYNDNQYITVGANRADSLNGGIKVSLTSAPYNSGDKFWLRTPYYYRSSSVRVAYPGKYVDLKFVYSDNSVVPAFRLNLSSVLFASAATAATSGASLTDTMTFRVERDDKITSKAYYSTDNVIVDVAEDETVYLYVQGKNGTTDWVYSQEVSADTTIATGTIKSGAKDSNGSAVSLTSVDLSQCEIWIEKKVTDDNLVYAVMAKEIITTVEVTDITAPVAGAELDVAATCNTTGVSTTTPTVSYTKNGESVSSNAAGYLAGYTATVELEAAVGYAFTDETTATINGNEASVSYDADTGKLTVSYTFDKTAKLPLGNAYYVTKDELMSSFDLDGTDDTVGKVYFGTNTTGNSTVPQTWYIAGSDAADSIVLLCDPELPLAKTVFEDDCGMNKTYDNSWNCTYETAPSWVYPNHYGASNLRGVLQGYTGNDNTEKFSAAEKELMQLTKVYTDDDKRKDEGKTDYTYYTEDKLYPAYGDDNDNQYITVGANSAESLNGGLKVSLTSAPYTNGGLFWLRAPYASYSSRALVAFPELYVDYMIVDNDFSVVPAFRLNLSSVLFASAATAATSDASLTDTMTFRVDDTEKIKSKAAYNTCGVIVNYDEGDENVFLYVQDADSVYSVEITEDTTLALSDMTGIESLTAENTKIWLEKSEDNVAYALMAEAVLTEHIDSNDDGICDHCDSYVEPKQEDEYYQIANANNLMWFAQQVNEGQTTINAKLTADIDMKDIDWTIMNSFAGTFDGDGHTILYLCADESGGDDDIANGSRCGLFQTLSEGGTVTNLTISGAQLWSAHSAGAIAAVNNGTISKCIVKDSTIELGASHGLAAIAGTNTGTVTDCGAVNCFLRRRWGSANSSDYAIGVIVEDNSGTVSNCFSYGCTFSNSPNIYAIVESGNAPVNCYYYTDATVSDTVATAKTAEAFASGEVAYLLNGSSSENVTWYQKLLTDTYPVLDSKHGKVYSVFKCDGTTQVYRNDNENEPHIDADGDGICDNCDFCVIPPLVLEAGSSVATVAEGKEVTITGHATGGKGTYTYSYLVYNKTNKQWTRLTPEFITDSEFTWKADCVGIHNFYVEVKDETGKVVRSSVVPVTVTVTVTYPELLLTGSVSADKVETGSNVTITGHAVGGDGTYTYSYLVYNKKTGSWTRLTSEFVTDNQFIWTTDSIGVHNVYVEVKDGSGKTVRSSAVTVEVSRPALSITGQASATTVIKGNEVTITGTAQGGTGDYTYSYLVHNRGTNEWTRLTSAFTTSNEFTYTIESEGTRDFYVEVKDGSGKTVRSSAIIVKVSRPALSINGEASASTVIKGNEVTITGTAEGGNGDYTYSYLVHNRKTNEWTRLTSAFITSNEFTYTIDSEGTRDFYVEVKDSTGKVVRSKAVSVTVTVSELAITAKASASSVTTGSKVTFTGTATGGEGSYTYSYLVYNKTTGVWARLTSSFVTGNTFTWTAGSAGTRAFYVEVKDATGEVVRSSAVNVVVK